MQVRLLGSVEVVVAGAVRPVPGLRRKAVLAMLGLHPGQIVSSGVVSYLDTTVAASADAGLTRA
ncbi:hypothetical protein ACFQO7_11075 [Catellatospora aurea]|uniref:Uncharacterized protein n=1 Tax=Catellatospora aurea TaxID=1337874 RepID=A0ABW2GSQ1_9ACTN